MLDKFFDWLFRTFLMRWVKSSLDGLPLDGKKTIVGLLVLVLGVIASAFPNGDLSSALNAILGMLQDMPYDDLQATGIGVLLVGLIHKVLKFFDKDVEEKPEEPKDGE